MKLAIWGCLGILWVLPARSGTVSYAYDEAGRLLRASYGSGKTILYTYDKAGNLLRRLVTNTQPGPAPSIVPKVAARGANQ